MKYIIGKWYYFKFWDHLKDDGGDEVYLSICGKVLEETNTFIRLTYWDCHSVLEDKETEFSNKETCKVIKSAIFYSKRLPI